MSKFDSIYCSWMGHLFDLVPMPDIVTMVNR